MTYEFRGMVIPGHMLDSLRGYIEHGCPVGHFLTAVLENDLAEACARADDDNMRVIPAYVAYLYNEAPGACWGSPENVSAWLERFKALRTAMEGNA